MSPASIRRVVVTGGAGFIGSHVCTALIEAGHTVTAIDNLSTGRAANITHLAGPRFTSRGADVADSAALDDLSDVSHIVHLACPASPKANTRMPVDTIRASTVGTLNVLDLAVRAGARLVCVSSSEVYGDPLEHPQTETYRGNCDPVGPFSAYTEGKRVLEAASAAYQRQGVPVGVIRPFNVYGPRMWPDDGRVVAAFCGAALRDETLTLAGGGRQTRSLTYVDDFVAGLIAMLFECDEFGPINLGNPEEVMIKDLAHLVIECAGSGRVEIGCGRIGEVQVRRPDITRARKLLGWEPATPLRTGVERTLDWMCDVLASHEEATS